MQSQYRALHYSASRGKKLVLLLLLVIIIIIIIMARSDQP